MTIYGPTTTGDSPKIKRLSEKISSFFKLIKTRRSSSVMDSFTNLMSVNSDRQLDTLGSDVSSPSLLQQLKAVFGRKNRVSPYTMPEKPGEQGDHISSSAASAASTNFASSPPSNAGSVGSEQGTPRCSNEGPKTLPESIKDIYNSDYVMDVYLENIQNLSFGVQDKDSGGAASSNVDYWKFLKHIIRLPLCSNGGDVGNSGGSSSLDGITREPDEGLEKIRTDYIRDTLTKIADDKAYIETHNNSQQISELVGLAMESDNASVLVELVKVLDKNGITQVFDACNTYLKNLDDQNLKKKETLKTALDQLLQNNDQMKLELDPKFRTSKMAKREKRLVKSR